MGKSTKYAIDYSSRISADSPKSDEQSAKRLAEEFGVREQDLTGKEAAGNTVKLNGRRRD